MTWTPLPDTVELTITNPNRYSTSLIRRRPRWSSSTCSTPWSRTPRLVRGLADAQATHLARASSGVRPGIQTVLAKARSASAKVLYVESLRLPESPDHTVFKGTCTCSRGRTTSRSSRRSRRSPERR